MKSRERTAIVIGAGHNGLTCAFYLARAGFKTQVLERRSVPGGCAVTEEIDPVNAPGCRVSTASYMASMLRPEVIRDMQLGRHGLRMIEADPGLQIALPDGRVLPWWKDPVQLREELDAINSDDRRAFFDLDEQLSELAQYLQPFFLEPPPDISATGLSGFLEVLRVGNRFRGLDGRKIAQLMEFLTGSLTQLLDGYFKSDEIKRLILANNLYGKHGGPGDQGSAMGLLFHLLSGGEDDQQGFSGHVIGGMGAITTAMAAACRENGVEIQTDTDVAEIQVVNGTARGVVLKNGQTLEADLVVSNADPKRTFLKLLPSATLEESFRQKIQAIHMDGPAAKVNLVLDKPPAVRGMPTDAPALQKMLFTLVPTLEAAQQNYNAAQQGQLSDDLWVDCVWASAIDTELATDNREVLTTFIQYLPFEPSGSHWDEKREWLGNRVIDIIGQYAPTLPESVVGIDVITPLDLERRFGLTEGNIFHGDIRLEQLFFMRPVPGWSHYRTPVERLYLCGAGTHPGGGVTGAPGHNAAQVILRDL